MASKGLGFRQPAKKRKREDVYNPLYHVEAGPGPSPNYRYEYSESTIFDDPTTFAEQTAAATSLGSNYFSSGSRPHVADNVEDDGAH